MFLLAIKLSVIFKMKYLSIMFDLSKWCTVVSLLARAPHGKQLGI
jgi:hypothetical protein